MPAQITPLDPDSEKGRRIADELSQVLAEIDLELEEAEDAERALAAAQTADEIGEAA